MAVSAEHLAMRELRNNIRDQDLIKARLVLDHFPEFSPMEQAWVIEALAECGDDFALPLLVSLASRGGEVILHFPELTELILGKALNRPELVIAQLARKSAERVCYAKLAGDLALQAAVPHLIGMLTSDTDQAALIAAINALAEIGDAESVRLVAEMLYAEEPELVRCAIEALGRFATPAAMLRLAERLGRDEEIDLRIIEVFARVQDEFSLHKLNELLCSRSAISRDHSQKMLVEVGSKCVPLLIENLSGNDSDLVIASLDILREIGDQSAHAPVRQLINTHPGNVDVRFAAYAAMAGLPPRKGDYVLAGGLVDPVEKVRISAARAIEHNLDEVLVAGIANMINRGDGEGPGIVRAILAAKAGRIFLALQANEEFRREAAEYLAGEAHSDLQPFFADLLVRNGQADLVPGRGPDIAASQAGLGSSRVSEER
ncbi:HEAT repeat domain-containing protein [Thiovibrio sp. JS02]